MFPLVLMTVMDDDDRNYMITIYEQYQWLMLVTARRYVQTSYDQEEIISEACLALIKKIPTLRTLESKKLSAYIATTVKNKARDYLTRQNARKNRYISMDSISCTITDDAADVERRILLSEEIALVARSINELPPKEKQVFLLKYRYNMDADVIAEKVGISKESVSKYFCRAKRKIKAAVYGGKVNLVDEHLEFMIRLACEAQEDAEIDELIAESQLEHTPEEKEITRNAYLLFQHKLAEQEQKERKDSRRRRVQRILPRTISVAACLVILLAIATPFAVANISSIRVKVLQMLIRIEEDHAKLSLVEDEDASFDVPSGWQGDYYPTYIPDGYEVSYIGRYSATVEFSNTEGNVLTFNECSESDQYNIDSENALMSYEFINGQQVFTVESTYTTSVAWSNGRKLFVVDGAMAKDELLKIAESVQLIK